MQPRAVQHSGTFLDNLKHLGRKERELQAAVDKYFAELSVASQPRGHRLIGVNSAPVYKDRLACGNRGTSGGYRVIYYCAEQLIRGLFIYKKNEKEDIPSKVVLEALRAGNIL